MPDNTSTEQSTPTTKADDGAPQSEEEEGGVPQASPATPTERSTTNVEVPVSNKPTSEAVPNNDAQTATSVATTPVSGSSTTVNADQQTLSATPSNANKAHDRGVSTGALAGGIIGAALAAALITGLVTFWYMRKTSYRNSRTSRHNDRHRRLYKDDKHTGLGAGRARRMELTSDASMSRASWEQYLPQSLDDHTIQNSVKVLFDQIQLHVENFYFSPHDPIKLPPEEHERLSELQTPHLPGPLVDCMMSSRSVLPVIKHCLAYQVAQGMMAGPQPRLLPMGFTYVGGDRGLPDSTGRKAVGTLQLSNIPYPRNVVTNHCHWYQPLVKLSTCGGCLLPTSGRTHALRQKVQRFWLTTLRWTSTLSQTHSPSGETDHKTLPGRRVILRAC